MDIVRDSCKPVKIKVVDFQETKVRVSVVVLGSSCSSFQVMIPPIPLSWTLSGSQEAFLGSRNCDLLSCCV